MSIPNKNRLTDVVYTNRENVRNKVETMAADNWVLTHVTQDRERFTLFFRRDWGYVYNTLSTLDAVETEMESIDYSVN